MIDLSCRMQLRDVLCAKKLLAVLGLPHVHQLRRVVLNENFVEQILRSIFSYIHHRTVRCSVLQKEALLLVTQHPSQKCQHGCINGHSPRSSARPTDKTGGTRRPQQQNSYTALKLSDSVPNLHVTANNNHQHA